MAVKSDLMVEPLLTPGEVAQIFRVDPKTVARWAKEGRLHPTRTPGGHRRYHESEIREIYSMEEPQQ